MGKRGESANDVMARAAVAGLVTGLRSQSVFAVLARAAGRGAFAANAGAPLGWLRSPVVRWLALLSAAGELLVDKLPNTPSRIEPGPLAGRAVFGAVAGGMVTKDAGRGWLLGIPLGVIGAVAGSYGGYLARKRAVAATGLPDPVVAAAEDAIAIGLGQTVVPGS